MGDMRGYLAGNLVGSGRERFSVAFPEIQLRRGLTPLEPQALPNLSPGEKISLDVQGEPIELLPAVQKIREAAARIKSFNLELREVAQSPFATLIAQKYEVMAVFPKLTGLDYFPKLGKTGLAFEIALRKL